MGGLWCSFTDSLVGEGLCDCLKFVSLEVIILGDGEAQLVWFFFSCAFFCKVVAFFVAFVAFVAFDPHESCFGCASLQEVGGFLYWELGAFLLQSIRCLPTWGGAW